MNKEEWSQEQKKSFLRTLVESEEDNPDRWERIATKIAGKTAEDVKVRYDLLAENISQIESGLVPLPNYDEVQVTPHLKMNRKKIRKKIKKWTTEEHRAFLRGIAVLGKGDWRGISRQYVPGRTPSQVASHAQKYFARWAKDQAKKKRRSIHDVGLETLAYPAVQPIGSSDGQPIHHRTDIDASMNGSLTQQAPQLRDPPAPAPAPAHSTPIDLRLQQLTIGTFIPLFRSNDPRASALNIPPLASRAPDTPAQSAREPHRPRGSFHNTRFLGLDSVECLLVQSRYSKSGSHSMYSKV